MTVMDALDLTGRRALVTGASRGIGHAIASALAQSGAQVALHGKTMADAQAGLAALPPLCRQQCTPLAADLAETGQGLKLAQDAEKLLGALDIVVLNASIQSRCAFEAVEETQFLQEIQVNLLAAYQLLQYVAPKMAARGWGRILTIGSVQQVRPNPALSVYAATKAAQLNLTLSLAKLYARSGVTVNNLAPGLIDTERNADLKGDSKAYRELLDRIPAGQAGTPQDCAWAALMLCSQTGRYITGVDLMVDGGLHLP